MSRTVAGAEIRTYKPNSNAVDTFVPGGDIKQISITNRLQNEIDQASITLNDNSSSYTGSITSGDKLEFLIRLAGQDEDDSLYGQFRYGNASYSEDELKHRWTGVVRTPKPKETGPKQYDLELEVDDFVFGTMDFRRVVNAFENEPISNGSDSILQTILANEASEIGTQKIRSVNTNADVRWNAKKLLECVRELAERGDALVAQRGEDLIFRRLSDPLPEFTLKKSDRGLMSAPKNDDDLVNQVRVEGGVDVNEDDTQTTQDSFETVTSSNRIQQRLSMSKATVGKVDVYTKKTGSGENVVVRIHPDDGNGNPVDVSSRDQDHARQTLVSTFLKDDGFTPFVNLSDHVFKRDPWLLIESDGSSGQDIGVDSNSNPTYKAYYPFQLASVIEDKNSQDNYRRREGVVREPEADTKAQTEAVGNAAIRHRSEPANEIEFPAESDRAHDLRAGDIVTVSESNLDVDGDYIVTERRDQFDGGRNELKTNITAQEVDTV